MKHYHYMILLLVSGIILAFTVSYQLHHQRVHKTTVEFETAAQDRIHGIQHTIENSLMIGRSVVSLFASSDQVTRREFAIFAQFVLENTTYIRALEWVPRVPMDKREHYEALGAQSFPHFKFTQQTSGEKFSPAGVRQEYYPVFYVEPFETNKEVLGFDLASQPKRMHSIEYARDNNKPSTTGRINLLQSNPNAWGILTFLPIYEKNSTIETTDQRRANFEGLIAIVYDMPRLVQSSLTYLQPAGIHFTIYDESATPSERFLYQHHSRTQPQPEKDLKQEIPFGDSHLTYSNTLTFNHRRWLVKTVPAAGYFDTAVPLEIWLLFIGINTITLLLIGYLNQARQREHDLRNEKVQLEITVSERTRDLKNKNKELETFSYSIAHDLRSPLRAITGFSQILVDDANDKLDKEEQDYLARIIAAGKNMSNLIDDILALSRVTQGKLNRKAVNLSEMARGIAYRIQNSNDEDNHHVVWNIADSMKADGDPHLLNLLLDNLLLNAYKFSYHHPKPRIEVGYSHSVGEKIFYVRDNGIGFDMKFVDKIFGVFQRLHTKDSYEGTGIGLATVKRIVERHHGRIWAIGTPNEGATFYFTLCPQPNYDDQYT